MPEHGPEHLPVLYRDDRLIAVHKPSGLLVHRSNIDRRETRFALQLVRDMTGRRVYPAHRLDKGTSGILVFAFDPEAAAILGRAFEQGLVEKRYLAIVRGWPEGEGRINHPLRRVEDGYGNSGAASRAGAGGAGSENFEVIDGAPAPQPALTIYRTLARAELPQAVDRYPTARYALVELEPRTGRRHQIRRHLKHIAHPVIGDATYGKGRHNRLITALFGTPRLLLCCTRMAFAHPSSGECLVLEAAPAEDFMAVVNSLGWAAALQASPGFGAGQSGVAAD